MGSGDLRGYFSSSSGIMIQLVFLLAAELVHQSGGCSLYSIEHDYGQDYLSWTGVSSLQQCQNKCKSTSNCYGITWVKNSYRYISDMERLLAEGTTCRSPKPCGYSGNRCG